ncbi:MAG: YdeI/OmpD-associated family protein [Bacteroidota bacterium]
MKSHPFEVSILGTHSILLPQNAVQPFVDKNHKRVRVVATFEGQKVEIYAALMKRHGNYYLMFSKNNQKALGIFPNDYFELQLFEDTTKYGVELSEEFEAVLFSDHAAYQAFESLSDGKKRGIIYMIARFKNSQTRIDKSLLLCENLKRGIRDPRLLLKSL